MYSITVPEWHSVLACTYAQALGNPSCSRTFSHGLVIFRGGFRTDDSGVDVVVVFVGLNSMAKPGPYWCCCNPNTRLPPVLLWRIGSSFCSSKISENWEFVGLVCRKWDEKLVRRKSRKRINDRRVTKVGRTWVTLLLVIAPLASSDDWTAYPLFCIDRAIIALLESHHAPPSEKSMQSRIARSCSQICTSSFVSSFIHDNIILQCACKSPTKIIFVESYAIRNSKSTTTSPRSSRAPIMPQLRKTMRYLIPNNFDLQNVKFSSSELWFKLSFALAEFRSRASHHDIIWRGLSPSRTARTRRRHWRTKWRSFG